MTPARGDDLAEEESGNSLMNRTSVGTMYSAVGRSQFRSASAMAWTRADELHQAGVAGRVRGGITTARIDRASRWVELASISAQLDPEAANLIW